MLRELEGQHGERVQFRYPDFYNANNREMLQQYAVRGHPTTVFVNADGTVARQIPGLVKPSEYVKALEALR